MNNKRILPNEWDSGRNDYSKDSIDRKIRFFISNRGWQHAIKRIHQLEIPYERLKVAEVGCGIGTFSLTLGLLGASVTLIDFNEKVLENAKKIYGLYGCEANFVKANCLEPPADKLKGVFDIVISLGLAEHFIEKGRERCIAFHEQIACSGGLVYIGVPNRLSLFYWIVRLFRQLIGIWRISLEVPFSNTELKTYAKKVGFIDFYIVGNASLYKDAIIYMQGLISAIGKILPDFFGIRLRSWKKYLEKNRKYVLNLDTSQDMKKYCLKKAKELEDISLKKDFLADKFSAGIILFAFK